MMASDEQKLLAMQESLAVNYGWVDVYRTEGKGVIAVKHKHALIPQNVIFAMDDVDFKNMRL